MPKRRDIKKVLVIGSGPIVIGQAANLIMREHKHVLHSKKKVMKWFFATLIRLLL